MAKLYEMDFDIILKQIEVWYALGEDERLKEFAEDAYAQDIAELLIELPDEQRDHFFGLLMVDKASAVLGEMDAEKFSQLVSSLSETKKVLILDAMSQDDIVDLLGELPMERRKEIIAYLDIEDARDVEELLVYDEDTAGGIMTKDFVVLHKELSIYQAIDTLRETAPDAETIYYVFVVDKKERLAGVISLRELIVSKPNMLIKEVMNENVISVNVHDDQEEVASIVKKYDLLAVPVVDDNQKLLGIVTVDDVLDVIEEEATEDILKFAGSSELEDMDEDRFFRKIYFSVRSRLPWLIITIFGGLLSSNVVKNFQGVIDKDATLALFMTMLAGMGGNVGTQSSTLTVRSIAMGYIEGAEVVKTVAQEMLTGLFVGAVCASISGVAATLIGGSPMIGVIVGLSMCANMFTAATIGTIVPITFKKIGVDPAIASAPFITTIVDITGLTIYFTLATILTQTML